MIWQACKCTTQLIWNLNCLFVTEIKSNNSVFVRTTSLDAEQCAIKCPRGSACFHSASLTSEF